MRYKNRIGEKYGRLTVISFAGRNEYSIKQKTVLWNCKCDCGTENHLVHARNLVSGRVQSCGCLAVEQSRKAGISRALPVGIAAQKRIYNKYINGAKQRNLTFDLDFNHFLTLITSNCHYCNSSPRGFTIAHRRFLDNEKLVHNGIDRIDSAIGYIVSNCVPCCKYCNFAKYDLSVDDFKNHIKKIAIHLNLLEHKQ